MKKLLVKMKEFYNTHFKHHCPDCDGIMDSEFLDMKIDKLVYKCRVCGKEWCSVLHFKVK